MPPPPPRAHCPRSALRVRLSLGRLEGRITPATFNIANGDVGGLINAINTANANHQSDTIILAQNGTYTFTGANNNDGNQGNNALPTILPDGGNGLTILGNGATFQRSTAAGVAQFRFLRAAGTTTTPVSLDVEGLTFANGDVNVFLTASQGGAIRAEEVNLTLKGCTFSGNKSNGTGGAVYVASSAAQDRTVGIVNSRFSSNTSGTTATIGTFTSSAALALSGSVTTQVISGSSFQGNSPGAIGHSGHGLTVRDCSFDGNTGQVGGNVGVPQYAGGITSNAGIFSPLPGPVVIENSTFRNNAVGTIYSDGNLTLTNSTVSGTSGGGGIITTGRGDTVITSSTISGNTTTGLNGAGISAGGGKLTIDSSTITGNRAQATLFASVRGGGIYYAGTSGGKLTITNSTIDGNSASQGGGVFFTRSDSTATTAAAITNSTITGNTASAANGGGGVYADAGAGTLTLGNTVVALNAVGTGPLGADIAGQVNSSGYNLIGNPAGATVIGVTAGNLTGNPGLGALQSNGGPTLTRVPQAGSPLIDAGNPNAVNAPPFDQRGTGFSRVQNGRIDIGAVESVLGTGGSGPGPGLGPGPAYAVGTDAGAPAEVKVYDGRTGQLRLDLFPYSQAFRGGARVALADFNRDGTPDVVTGAGIGGGPDVRLYDGSNGNLLAEFFPYDGAFRGGVYVAAGDVTGDGVPELVTGVGLGGGPHVRTFSYVGGSFQQIAGPLGSFFPYDAAFRGGVVPAVGDLNGDGRADIVTGVGVGGGPHVRAFSGADGSVLLNFFPYEDTFRGGVLVAAGDVDGDGKADVITSPGPGGGPLVKVFRGTDGSLLRSFFAYASAFRGGARVAAADVDGDGVAEILTGAGPGGGPHVQAFDGRTGQVKRSFLAYDPTFTGGVFVGGA